MKKVFLIRIDDISWDMNYENFDKMRKLLIKYGVQPIIGIIPCNKDLKLKKQIGKKHIDETAFWEEMRNLQREHGWAVALHGYEHVYCSSSGGMFNVNPKSEFAGLPFEVQYKKIKEGKRIFRDHGIKIDAFMAPSHSLDWITVEALKKNNIFIITDGKSFYPYKRRGVWFIPQMRSWPDKREWGYDTVCYHINQWDERRFEQVEEFLRENYQKIGSFNKLVSLAVGKRQYMWVLGNIISKPWILFRRCLSEIKRSVKGAL